MNTPKEILEEQWNAYSHALGIILGLLGTLVLFLQKPTQFASWPFAIYSFSVILLFTASTLYHSFYQPAIKEKLRILDHISIYYLIAGTYTPVCWFLLKDSRGVLLLILVWSIALIGTGLKLFYTGKFEVLSLVLYGVMGWLIVIDLPFLLKNFSESQLFYLALGGVFYTLGMVFYAVKKIPFNHLIWHFFVLGGAISHWFLVFNLV